MPIERDDIAGGLTRGGFTPTRKQRRQARKVPVATPAPAPAPTPRPQTIRTRHSPQPDRATRRGRVVVAGRSFAPPPHTGIDQTHVDAAIQAGLNPRQILQMFSWRESHGWKPLPASNVGPQDELTAQRTTNLSESQKRARDEMRLRYFPESYYRDKKGRVRAVELPAALEATLKVGPRESFVNPRGTALGEPAVVESTPLPKHPSEAQLGRAISRESGQYKQSARAFQQETDDFFQQYLRQQEYMVTGGIPEELAKGNVKGAAINAAFFIPWLRGPRAVLRGVHGAVAVEEGATAGRRARAGASAARRSFREPGPIAQGARRMRVRVYRHGDLEVPIPAARSRTGRALERLTDYMRPLTSKIPLVSSESEKTGKELGRTTTNIRRMDTAEGNALLKVARKLNQPQEYVLRILGEGVLPAERIEHHVRLAKASDNAANTIYHAMHAETIEKAQKYITSRRLSDEERQAIADARGVDVGQVRDVIPVLRNDAPDKLKEAWRLAHAVSRKRESIYEDIGRALDDAFAERVSAPGRIMSGGRWKSNNKAVRESLNSSQSRSALFNEIDARVPDPIEARSIKAMLDAEAKRAAITGKDPSLAGRIYDELNDMTARATQGAADVDPAMLEAATQQVTMLMHRGASLDEALQQSKATLEAMNVPEESVRARFASGEAQARDERVLSNRDPEAELTAGVQATLGESGGHTWHNNLLSDTDATGYAVSIAGAERTMPAAEFNEEAVRKFRQDNLDALNADPDLRIGAWNDEGTVYLDLTKIIPDREEALSFGAANNQRAIYDRANQDVIEVTPDTIGAAQQRIRETPQSELSALTRAPDFKGGKVQGEDVMGAIRIPYRRGVPGAKGQPARSVAAYISSASKLFGGGRRTALGKGPDDKYLRSAYKGSLLLSGAFKINVSNAMVEDLMTASKLAAAKMSRKALLKASTEMPQDVSDVAIKVNPDKNTPEELRAFWDRMDSDEKVKLEGMDFNTAHGVFRDIFPAELDGEDIRQIAARALEDEHPIDNIRWVSRDVIDSTGMLQVPQAARLMHAGLDKTTRRILQGTGMTFDAVNDLQKALILYLNPAYIPVNLTGNLVMNFMQQGAFMVPNLWRSAMMHRNLTLEQRSLVDSLMGHGLTASLGMRTTPGRVINATLGHWINQAVDLIPRRSAFLHEARVLGHDNDEKLSALLQSGLEGDAQARTQLDYIARRANDAIVDYERLSPIEREVFARWIFFYPWLKGASRYSVRFIAEHPMQAMGIALAVDNMLHASQQQLGDRPDYAQLDVPISTESAGLHVPGTDLGVTAADVVGEHTWTDRGYPMVTNVRQALTFTTPFELIQTGIGFATGNQETPSLAESLTPLPYAVGIATFGYDPFKRQEVPRGLSTFLGQFYESIPLKVRLDRINMTPGERRAYQKRALQPRTRAQEIQRLFGGGLAPAPYNPDIGQQRVHESDPAWRLLHDSKQYGLGQPPLEVMKELDAHTKLTHSLHHGMTPVQKLRAAVEVYAETSGDHSLDKEAKGVKNEAAAQEYYLQLRRVMFPALNQWQSIIDQQIDANLATQTED